MILLVLLFAGCNKETSQKSNNLSAFESKLKSAEIVNASNKFGFNLLKDIEKHNTDKNLFISPFSALEALSMTYNGAVGVTKKEMASVLGFSDNTESEVNNYNQSLTKALKEADEKVLFEVANSIWYKQNFEVLQSFIDVNKTYYDAEVSPLNFFDPTSVHTINNWVSEKTHEKIPTIIDQIPPEAMMYLINAIYFKGTWMYQFDTSMTSEQDFFKSDGNPVKHQQMAMQAVINYYNNEDFQVAELPYGTGTFNFDIILPNAGKNLSNIISGLNDTKWKEMQEGMTETQAVLKMPKFKLELSSLLKNYLIELGMESAFNTDSTADFSRIDSAKDLSISQVIHKTYVDLDEAGTEAAAVTAVGIIVTAMPGGTPSKIIYFTADKPFIYAISEKSTGVVIFIGKMMDPTITNVEIQ